MNRKPFGFVTKDGRFIRQDVLDGYAVKSSESSRKLVDAFAKSYVGHGLLQPLYNPEALARTLEVSTYHAIACLTKARDTVGQGWGLASVVDKPSEIQKAVVEKFFAGLDTTLESTLERVMLDFEAVGYAAMELVREGYTHDGIPSYLGHIPVHTLRAHRDGNKYCQIRARKMRWFRAAGYEKDVHMDTGDEREPGALPEDERASELLWMVNYTPRSDVYGLPNHLPALGAIHGDIARRDYNIAFFANFGVPAYAVIVTGNFDPGDIGADGRSELERVIEAQFAELSKNPHSILILTVPTLDPESKINVHFEPLSTEIKEASFRLYRKDNRDEVLAAHGVPPYRAGIVETGSLGGNTARESTEIYKMSILRPRKRDLEGLINRWIMGPLGVTDWRFDLREIDTVDEAHDLAMLTGIFKMGGISPNGIARHFADQYGTEPVDHPAMDAHYVADKAITLTTGDHPVAALNMLKAVRDQLLDHTARDA